MPEDLPIIKEKEINQGGQFVPPFFLGKSMRHRVTENIEKESSSVLSVPLWHIFSYV